MINAIRKCIICDTDIPSGRNAFCSIACLGEYNLREWIKKEGIKNVETTRDVMSTIRELSIIRELNGNKEKT